MQTQVLQRATFKLTSGQTCEEMDGHGEAGAEAGLLKKRLRLR